MSTISRRQFIGTSGAVTAMLGLAACGGQPAPSGSGSAAAPAGKGGGTITGGSGYAGNNFHPDTTSSAFCMGVNINVMEGLYGFDFHDFSVYNQLAADDPVKVDDTTYEITLRDGAKFSDGTDVKAEDVVSSFKRASAEGNIYQSFLTPFSALEVKDDKTVTVKLAYPFGLIKQRLAVFGVIPTSMSDDDATAKPICTGPWKFDEISADGLTVTLVPNEYYNGKFPAKDEKLTYTSMVDDTARVTAAMDGTTMVMENVPADSIDQLTGAGLKVDSIQGFSLPFLAFDCAKDPWKNNVARQAILYALNVPKMIENVLLNQATAASCYIPETFANYNKAANVYTYDPEKAKKLLADAGVTPGDVTLNTTDHGWIVAMAAQVKEDLDAIGFKTTINTQQSSAIYADLVSAEGWGDFLLAPGDPSCFGNDPDLLMCWFYADGAFTKTRTFWQTGNPDQFKEVNDLMDKARQEVDADAQQKIWNECFDKISEYVPLYPLLHRKVSTAYQAEKIADFAGIPIPGMDFLGAATTGA